MVNYDDYMDDDFVDYEMYLHKVIGNKFTFRVKLAERMEYGQSTFIINFLSYECLYYLRHNYPEFIGNRIHIIISREYNGGYHNFASFEVVL